MTVGASQQDVDPPRRTSVISYDSDEEQSPDSDGEGPLDRETCCDLARSAMHYTSHSQDEQERNYGRQLLSEATSRRRIPGLGEESCTMQDCLTAYYLSEANRNLGRENSRHYYLQEALTLVESLMLRKQKPSDNKQETGRREYESAKVNARQVLAEWTGRSVAQSTSAA